MIEAYVKMLNVKIEVNVAVRLQIEQDFDQPFRGGKERSGASETVGALDSTEPMQISSDLGIVRCI
jgi:hypothetical protein